ncbi:MAG: hypothetical protein B7Z16_10545 [Algoriphagus sp. 32-45-6]|nr:MAG: hypothetical protein B7Z16_10545 [Algoriphagus sp. 32-45-6]
MSFCKADLAASNPKFELGYQDFLPIIFCNQVTKKFIIAEYIKPKSSFPWKINLPQNLPAAPPLDIPKG